MRSRNVFLLGAHLLYFPTSRLMASMTSQLPSVLLLNVIPSKGWFEISIVDGANLEGVLNEFGSLVLLNN